MLRLFTILALLVGAAVRIWIYSVGPSMAEDELSLSLNIAGLDFKGLLGESDLHQTLPIGFLWLVKSSVLLLGLSEYSLRLIPFLAGLPYCQVSYGVGRRFIGERGGFFLTTLFSLSPSAASYSNTVKQYGPDILVTLQLLLLASETRKPWQWILGGTLALFLSVPAIFIWGGIWMQHLVLVFEGLEKALGFTGLRWVACG